MEKLINNLKDEVVEMEKQAEMYKTESSQKDMHVSDLQKKMVQQDGRLKNSMKMFVNMRDDRDYYSHSTFQLHSELKERDKRVESLFTFFLCFFTLNVNHSAMTPLL